MSNHESDRNLLFGVLALQADLIDTSQFAEACAVWSSQKDKSLAAILVQRGWLRETDRSDVERLAERKLRKHANDLKASLAEAVAPVQHLITGVAAGDIQRSLADLPRRLEAPTRSVLGEFAGEALNTAAYVPQRQSRYTLVRLHARGGLGRVWVARDDALGRDVALKEILPELADSATLQARFLREARITGQLEHPGIVPLYELISSQDGRPCYTMRLVKGRTLSAAIKDYHQTRVDKTSSKLGLRDLLTAFLGVSHAVAFAHSRGIVHRDLKGSNVILGDFGEVILLDWGLAKESNDGDAAADNADVGQAASSGSAVHTLAGQVLGTPAYMAPEQAAGDIARISNRTDIYSLGVMLYEILAGRLPFSGSDAPEVLQRVLNDDPPPPRRFNPQAPPALEAICRKALAKRPEDRFATVEAMSADIRCWLADEAVSCYREHRAARIRRWARRNRVLVAALLGLELAGVLALGGGLTLYLVSRSRIRDVENREAVSLGILKNALQTSSLAITEEDGRSSPVLAAKRIKNLEQMIKRQQEHSLVLAGALDDSTRTAYVDLGRANGQLGRAPEAIEPLQKALALLALPGKDEKEAQSRQNQSLAVFMQLGESLIDAGRTQEAIDVFQKGDMVVADITGQNATASPPEAAIFIRGRLANALRKAGRPDESRIQYRRALETARAYEQRSSNYLRTSTYAAYEIGLFQMGAALLEHQQGRYVEAADLYRDAERNQRRATGVVDQQLSAYDYMQFRGALANTLYWKAILACDQGSPATAKKDADEALALLTESHKTHSALAYLRIRLARAHILLGEISLRKNDPAGALASFQKRLEIAEALRADAPVYVDGFAAMGEAALGVARAQKRLKQDDAAKQAIADAITFAVPVVEYDPLNRYQYARALAFVGRSDDAVAALQQARAAGWGNVQAVRNDPCWDSLKAHAPLQDLLQELVQRSK